MSKDDTEPGFMSVIKASFTLGWRVFFLRFPLGIYLMSELLQAYIKSGLYKLSPRELVFACGGYVAGWFHWLPWAG